MYDLLIKGGTVIDPTQNLNGAYDVRDKRRQDCRCCGRTFRQTRLPALSRCGADTSTPRPDRPAHACL